MGFSNLFYKKNHYCAKYGANGADGMNGTGTTVAF